jgi:CCR4-NOT transcription complex subunit 10
VAVYVCLLLLDVLVHCSRGALLTSEDRHSFAQQTEEVLGKMEKLAVSGSSTDGGEGGNEGGNKDSSSSSSSSGAEASSSSSSSSASPPFSPEQAADLEFRVHLYRAKALLMQQHLKASKKEIKTALEILQKSKFNLSATTPSSSSSSSSSGGSEWGSSAPALRNMSALYLKANFEYLRQVMEREKRPLE